MLLSAGFFFTTDNSEATDGEKAVSVTVDIPEGVTGSVDHLAVAFVNSSHYVVCHVSSDGKCTPSLKIGQTYTVSCFNIWQNGANLQTVLSGEGDRGTMMDYVHYGSLEVNENTDDYTATMEKGIEYTDSDGNLYYTYASGFATLVRLGVQFEKNMVKLNGIEQEVWQVKGDHKTLVIPEKVNGYDVVFVGANAITGRSLIFVDESYPATDNDYTDAMFRGSACNSLNVVFEGTVILNTQPFTKPHGENNGIAATDENHGRFNFNIIFENDVFVNSYGVYRSNQKCSLIPCTYSLAGINEVTVDGVFHGAYAGSWGTAGNPASGAPSMKIGTSGLNNCGIDLITLGNNLILNSDPLELKNTEIGCLGLLSGNNYSVTQGDEGYSLSIGGKVANENIASLFNNLTDPFLITTFINGEPSYILVSAGESKVLDNPVVEGYEFAGWFADDKYEQECTQNAFTESATIYAKFNVKQYNLTITGDGIEVRDGNTVVNSGSKLDYGTELTIAISERIGYKPTLKFDGVVLSVNTITVPARDFTISCEWAAIDYVVKCMDGETEVKTIQNCHIGDVVTLPAAPAKADMNFNGWKINGLLLGAQYVVDYRDVGEGDVITLTADYSAVVKTTWSLTVTGAEGKAFWTKTNEIGSYGMVTVILGEFEKADIPASAEYSVGKISDNTFMIYSVNDADITVAVNITEAAKATKYSVSLTEVAKTQGDGTVPGFKATVTADDGYIDTDGTFLVRYVYKELDTETGLWCFTTSGQTTGVKDWDIELSEIGTVGTYSKDMYLEDKPGAYLVYGFATYTIENASVTGGVEVFTSPVIMSVSQIQAVIGKP